MLYVACNCRKPVMEMTVYIKKDSQHNNNYNGAICFKHAQNENDEYVFAYNHTT